MARLLKLAYATTILLASITSAQAQPVNVGPIPWTAVGKPFGVPGLDGAGNNTAPINSASVSSQILRSGAYAGGNSYAGEMAASPLLSVGTNTSLTGALYDLPADNPPYQWAEILGGQHADAKAFKWQVGQPDSGNLGAVVDFVAMNGMSLGQGTGVNAGGFNTMLSYMNYDAAARATRTGSTPPKFVASAAVTDPDGVAHAVTFSSTGASFSPALPAYWGRMIHAGMNVATNEIGAKSIPQNNWNMPWLADGFRKTYNMYFGTITSWDQASDGTVSGITVDGWVVPMQQASGLGSATGKVPGVDTLDGSDPALDTTFTSITKPAILFGIYTKAFTQYELCGLTQTARGDINNPNGTVNNLVHECDHEVDMWSGATTDYTDSIHGYTLALSGSHKLTHDSYGWTIAGGGILPLGYHARNLLLGSPAYQAMANGSIVQSNLYAPYAIGTDAGDTSLLQTWGNELASGGVNTSTLRLIQYRDAADTAVATEYNATAQSKVSLHLQWKFDLTKNPMDESGAIGGQIVYNPAGYEYGIGLGAGGTFQNPNYGLIVDKTGNIWLPAGGAVMNGQGLGFVPASGDASGHPYIAATDAGSMKFATSSGSYASVNLWGLTTNGGAVTVTGGQGLAIVPASGDTNGHPYFYALDQNIVVLTNSVSGTNFTSTDVLSSLMANYVVATSFQGDISSTTYANGRPFSSLYGSSANIYDFGAKGDGVTDDSNALTTAIHSADRQTKDVYIPYGNICLKSYIALPRNVSLQMGSGVQIRCSGGIVGLTDAVNGTYGHTTAMNTTNVVASAADYISLVNNPTTYTTAYEHDGQYIHVVQEDSSLTVNKDLVASRVNAAIFSGVTTGRIWGGDTTVNIPSDANGYSVGHEIELYNAATSGDIDSTTAHIGLSVLSNGTSDGTTAIMVGGSNKWQNGIVGRQSAISTYFIRLMATGSLAGADDLMNVDASGNIKTKGGLDIGAGQGIVLRNPGNDGTTEAPMLVATGAATVRVGTNTGQTSSIEAWSVSDLGGGITGSTVTSTGTLTAKANIVAAGDVQTSGYFHETLTTPASSTATCTAGQFTDDANYHYVCVATNTWKRVALATW